MGGVQPFEHRARRVIVERIARGQYADADARHQAIDHDAHHRDAMIRPERAHVAIARHIDQFGQRVHQQRDIGGQRRHIREALHDRIGGIGQICQQDIPQDGDQPREIVGSRGDMRRRRGRGIADGVPPLAGDNQLDHHFRMPLDAPKFVERPLRARHRFRRHAPIDAQQCQAMQQDTTRKVRRLAQIEIVVFWLGNRLEL